MKIFIASDHGGFYLKEELKGFLVGLGHSVEDMGNKSFDKGDDYPDYIFSLAEVVAASKGGLGIVIGRSGIGEAIAANKVNGVYAALCTNLKMAHKAREHNNANVISLGADYVGSTTAKRMVDIFLNARFSQAQRHKRRVTKIKKYEAAHFKKS